MMVDHVTVMVPVGTLDECEEMLAMLGLRRVDVDSVYAKRNKKWEYRHYADEKGFRIHVVEPAQDEAIPKLATFEPGLGHFRTVVDQYTFEQARTSRWCERDAGAGRIWLRARGQLRVEVTTPASLTAEQKARLLADLPAISGDLPPHLAVHNEVLQQAFKMFKKRDESYADSWKVYGWRGALYNVRRKAERAWAQLWNLDTSSYQDSDEDDLLDIINYAAMTIQCMREGNRNGTNGWWDV